MSDTPIFEGMLANPAESYATLALSLAAEELGMAEDATGILEEDIDKETRA